MMSTRRFIVRGRVQGVGYRYFAQRAAEEIGITGHVRNLDDGRVEAFAMGTPEQLDQFCARLWQGPRWADVRGVDVEEAGPFRCKGFRVAP